jgi:hypothetical protein
LFTRNSAIETMVTDADIVAVVSPSHNLLFRENVLPSVVVEFKRLHFVIYATPELSNWRPACRMRPLSGISAARECS